MVHNPALSAYGAASVAPSPVNRMMAAFAVDFRDGVDINLGVGYVNEGTIPGPAIADAVCRVTHAPERYRQVYNYGGPAGAASLQHAIHALLRHSGVPATALENRRTIIGGNGATSILEGLASVLEPGIVITADPYYYIYCEFLQRRGFEVITVPEDAEGLSTDALRGVLKTLGARRHSIRFLYAVTVNNPTCSILSERRRRELIDIASELSDEIGSWVPLIADAAYEMLIHDPTIERPPSVLTLDERDGAIEVGTLSKVFAPALRIGYATGPRNALMDALVQRTSDGGFSAPLILQSAAALLLEERFAEQQTRVNMGYREKAVAVRAAIERELGPHLEEIRGGQAGFYFYLTFRDVETVEGSAFYQFLARTTGNPATDGKSFQRHPRVVYIPGSFCVHPHGAMTEIGRRQLRISYGFESTGRIVEAIGLMGEAVAFACDTRRCGV